MKKTEYLQAIEEAGIVAVVRGDSKENGKKTSEALIRGGLKGIEVTFTMPKADEVIEELSKENGETFLIGAGTVLDATTARLAIMAGAKFIVSPCFDEKTALLCNLYQIPYIPGCMTITEMKQAMSLGADIVKLFPGSSLGPDFVKAAKAPLPMVNIMSTGGVSLENMSEWFKAGVIAVGVGGNLVKPAARNDFAAVEENARQYVKEFEKLKNSR
ncbi:bifunctional 4-hydroxy-2-oxoglutarate aldolase/2-dehydro-3-deoxy-phosphogluconate aldolase [Enterococcus camelliae]|uniref:Bifunctional 4-hydroxy-2-oxoglutarate aldolase/2-dehydro-3-deoxy-phosphogluconate aldolase n=1 Tax=Enterococcus camelliae TaxID=453959 RepID=A0ABW5TJV8_9ENTE